ncbi:MULTISPECIES: hypothetical protein [Mammaliicoccus]|uniref:hypothetical protein n=1 Tax=Mammaliicoccus TaxID=2803850 RepID=UPI001781F29E|nr:MULTISPECIES: hypothetical protein [Mammaliicoccus]MCD8797394.1 hypothetical protein [Mammaliicoccus sciuri]UXU84632.1 hypothetical protein MUA77_04185 [Mammaliicoccus sciuri]UXU94480.1 hypothetical protein MUA42_04195 [Mammaliicoccus sciuri]UXV16428.1 hypothetical protein MUA89_04190 [Mammaliicoccus sciuri]UXV24690.1 hypothetical protein MUA49_04190 [Mammaliicoccus sciuri]
MKLSKIKDFLMLLVANLTGILFLLGLTLVNIAMYLRFNEIVGLVATGLTFILIALIIDHESKPERR